MIGTRKPTAGSALVTIMALTAVVLSAVGGIIYYAGQERARAINVSRNLSRYGCAEAGLQMARAFYGVNYNNWNTYLADGANYNPLAGADPWGAALVAAHPELFADLDGDGKLDVYMYIRDNPDELPPAIDNPNRDNDQVAIVGAVCISSTLVPRRADGTSEEAPAVPASRNALIAEGMLAYIDAGLNYCSQKNGCGNNQGNLNR